MAALGVDTSNYTTSVAIRCGDDVRSVKKLLPVKDGALGLRQSDAVFHHTSQLPPLLDKLFDGFEGKIEKVGVSVRPRDVEGSYMPCFLVGKAAAVAAAKTAGARYAEFSHQAGHIASALYSAGVFDELAEKKFLAFHVSGGTTEAVLVEPSAEKVFKCSLLAGSMDLKAGQAVDRVGAMLGLGFPAGAHLERLALMSNTNFKIKVPSKGADCSFSGLENKCRTMKERGTPQEDIALYCIEYIGTAIEYMTSCLLHKYGDLPVIYAGGVMSNSIIRKRIEKKFGGKFAAPEFSSDNALGVALLADVVYG